MGKIVSAHTPGTTQVYQIRNAISAFLFSFDVAKADMPITSQAVAAAEVVQFLNDNVQLSVHLKPKNGKNKYLYPKMGLGTLIEEAQAGEGYVDVVSIAVDTYQVRFGLPLTQKGSIQLDNDEEIILDLTTDAVVTNLDIYGLETPLASPTYRSVTVMSMTQGNKNDQFDVSEFDTILIPMSAITATTDLQIVYTNGESPKFLKTELEILGKSMNDCLVAIDGVSTGGNGLFAAFDASAMERIEVRRDSVTAFDIFGFTDEPLEDMQKVYKINRSLVSKSTEVLDRKVSSKFARSLKTA